MTKPDQDPFRLRLRYIVAETESEAIRQATEYYGEAVKVVKQPAVYQSIGSQQD